jgi:hypothetical protein
MGRLAGLKARDCSAQGNALGFGYRLRALCGLKGRDNVRGCGGVGCRAPLGRSRVSPQRQNPGRCPGLNNPGPSARPDAQVAKRVAPGRAPGRTELFGHRREASSMTGNLPFRHVNLPGSQGKLPFAAPSFPTVREPSLLPCQRSRQPGEASLCGAKLPRQPGNRPSAMSTFPTVRGSFLLRRQASLTTREPSLLPCQPSRQSGEASSCGAKLPLRLGKLPFCHVNLPSDQGKLPFSAGSFLGLRGSLPARKEASVVARYRSQVSLQGSPPIREAFHRPREPGRLPAMRSAVQGREKGGTWKAQAPILPPLAGLRDLWWRGPGPHGPG